MAKLAIDLPTLLLGITWACAAFTCLKAAKHTYMCVHRSGRPNMYIIMVWLEWASCLAVSIASWMYLEKRLHPNFGYFFGMLTQWVIQIQCITQIIINRVGLIMFNPRRVLKLKIWVAVFIGVINVSVFCVWIPARLHDSDTLARVNQVWDRVEKCIFMLLELALNGYFMWLIHSELIANGLRKYYTLFKFNVAMVVLSISLDGVIIGVMSLRNDLIYIQFHSLFFLVKLHIEMTVAELIAKIAKTTATNANQSTMPRQERRSRRRSTLRFSQSISWHQLCGLDFTSHHVRRPLTAEDDGVDSGGHAADVERGPLPPTSSRTESERRDRLDSTATTEVDSNERMHRMEKQLDNETCDNCGSRRKPRRHGWGYGLRSTSRNSI